MWYLILALLFGQANDSAHNGNKGGQQTIKTSGDHDGETDTPRPPKNN